MWMVAAEYGNDRAIAASSDQLGPDHSGVHQLLTHCLEARAYFCKLHRGILQLLQQPDTPLVVEPIEPPFKLVALGIDLRDQSPGLERPRGGIEGKPTGV